MENQLTKITESDLKMQTATAMAQTLSFSFERKYLETFSSVGTSDVQLFHLKEIATSAKSDAQWIAITQVGRPLKDNAEFCFTAMQKILYSCFLPKKTQLLFLITNDGVESKMYLGVRPISQDKLSKRFSQQLSKFIRGQWPGLKCNVVDGNDEKALKHYAATNFQKEKFDNVYALTGIPSMESQYKSLYPATIDQLMAGMSSCKNFAYLVVADPIDNADIDNMLYCCRDMNGQAESLKSFNISEGVTSGITKSVTDGTQWNHTDGISKSKSGKDWSGAWNKIKGGAGIGLALGGIALAATVAFPPAGAAMGSIASAVASGIGAQGAMSAGSLLLGLMGNKSEGESHSDSYGGSHSVTEGMSASQSQTVSHNVVNKHIEAVAEHLFYHSKRLEIGKAIGMWKVGAYLLSDNEPDAQAGTMQLKSILSGQESIYEPIRVTNLSTCIDVNKSFGLLQSPLVYIKNADNQTTFDHPLGEHYKELKTVLTTKELSYLINFPLRSVPGISVVDSSPEFNLTAQAEVEEGDIAFGKLLYGGSETSMPYHVPLRVLSRHVLLSGINGSGKTNTVQSILNNIGGLPFLVIEPAKTEYVDWALEHNSKYPDAPIDIYIPGCKKYKGEFKPKPLRLNPFEIVWLEKEQEPNVLTHIDRLKSVFASAFPMYDILPVLMEDLIYTVYQRDTTNWLGVEPQFGVSIAPTLNSMSVSVDQVIEHRQYEDKVQRNMKACLNTRIDSLKRGWKGEMLNTLKSTPWDELFNRRVLINLSYVGDDTDKAFFMALVLQFLYEYRTAAAELGRIDFNDNSCKHLTVIEEAHRVMSKCENQELPQYKSAMMFSNMLSEIRAYGEGLMLVDQVPTRLIPDAIKNTNLKITHRLVAEDDCKEIGQSMGLNEEQRKVIPKLLTGQCVVSSSLETNAYWVKADKVK